MEKRKPLTGIALLLILPLLLLACTVRGDEELGAAEEESGGSLPATVSPEVEDMPWSSPTAGTADNTPAPLSIGGSPTATGGADAPEAESARATIVATPATVNLGEITPVTTAEGGEATEMPLPGVPDPAQTMAGKATSDLAQYLDVDPAEIEVLSIEAMDWPDSSLGCARPGQSYQEVITPGFEITLKVLGREFAYHTDREETVIRCDAHPGDNESGSP